MNSLFSVLPLSCTTLQCCTCGTGVAPLFPDACTWLIFPCPSPSCQRWDWRPTPTGALPQPCHCCGPRHIEVGLQHPVMLICGGVEYENQALGAQARVRADRRPPTAAGTPDPGRSAASARGPRTAHAAKKRSATERSGATSVANLGRPGFISRTRQMPRRLPTSTSHDV